MASTMYKGHAQRNRDDNSELDALIAARDAAAVSQPGETPITAEEIQEAPVLLEPTVSVEDADWKKRYADLRRHQAATEKATNDKLKAMQEQLEAATRKAVALPATEQEVATWMEQYPEVANIVKSIAIKMAQDVTSEADARLKKVEEQEAQFQRERALANIMKAHPDFDDIKEDVNFHTWARAQPGIIQKALYESSDWAGCVRALDLYKSDLAKLAPKPKAKTTTAKDASMSVDTGSAKGNAGQATDGGKRRFKESEIRKMNAREYDRLEAEIDTARREGRFDYDLSGGAM